MSKSDPRKLRDVDMPPAHDAATRLVHGGRPAAAEGGRPVNSPLIRASTVLFDSVEAQRDARRRRGRERLFTYGSRGTPTTFALEDMICDLEGGFRTRLLPTGLAASTMALAAYLRPSDHVLITDCVYEPVRHFAETHLKAIGVQVDYCAADGGDVAGKLRPNTRLIYLECPGSLVYEMCDLPKIAALARSRGILVAADNTWGSGLLYRPLVLGAHISIIAATKYLGGHSDVMLGTVTTTEKQWQALQDCCDAFGMAVSPDDAWLVMRGMRSLSTRLARHEASALMVARWLGERPEVASVFCPALPTSPGHEIWKRDFSGANGLLSFALRKDFGVDAAERFANALKLFGIGSSWGGFESLVSLPNLRAARTVSDWSQWGPIVRLHIGLEEPQDLLDDLGAAFAALATPGSQTRAA